MHGRKGSFSACFCSHVLWLPLSLQIKAVFTWCWQVRLLIKKHDRTARRNSHRLLWAAGLAPAGGGEETDIAHKRTGCIKPRPGNAGNEIQYAVLLLHTVGRVEPSSANSARRKPLGGQVKVTGTEIQHILGEAETPLNPRGLFIHSLNSTLNAYCVQCRQGSSRETIRGGPREFPQTPQSFFHNSLATK